MRVDFNVPIKNGVITDDTRIKKALFSLELLIQKKAKTVLISHLGDPQKKEKDLSLFPIVERLEKALNKKILWHETIDDSLLEKISSMQPSDLLLLENIRFFDGEKSNDDSFKKALSSLGSIYINEAFSVSHRKHSSIMVAEKFPQKYIGSLFEKEVKELNNFIDDIKRPFYVIFGGKKLSTKLPIINAMEKKADKIFIGGAMAYTLLKKRGIATGDSLVEDDLLDNIVDNDKIMLPIDFVLDDKKEVDLIPAGKKGLDIGKKTVALWTENISDAGSIFWNGPLGVYEKDPFAKGTKMLADSLFKIDCYKALGGGDIIAALLEKKRYFNHVSMGGGASLEYIANNGKIPGIEALS